MIGGFIGGDGRGFLFYEYDMRFVFVGFVWDPSGWVHKEGADSQEHGIHS